MPALPPAFLTTPIAHRGYHDRAAGRIENSRDAIRAAVSAGYGIEIDIQPSSDGVAMVFHDDVLDRLTAETGPIRARPAAALQAMVLKDGPDGIPTLAEVLALIGGRVPLLIEIKDQDGANGPNVGPLEAAVATLLADYTGPVAVMSFNPHSVAVLATLAPSVPRGLTSCTYPARDWPDIPEEERARLRGIPDYDRVGASFISHEAADLANPRVTALKGQGAAILCWTIRSPAAETEARRIADNITFERYPAPIPS
ncbi:MAG: phosphodiesterase [Rhodobacteraceae bacterium]|nr:phosphodiesterase [Paracoccaceae bacterium]